MGMDPVTIGLIISAVGAVSSIDAQSQARQGARDSKAAKEKVAAEQRASNASEAARERRQQIREERVKRARVLQSAENTGTAGSSGEIGAVGSLATQLSTNIGANLGRLQTAENLSIFGQDQANANFSISKAQNQGQEANWLINNAGTFGKIGGAIAGSSIFKTPDYIGSNNQTGPGN